MKMFKLPITELIRVWQECCVTVEAESAEDIYESIQKGTFMMDFTWEDISVNDTFLETVETLDWDYSNTSLNDIKEV